jgi:zinc and cadmium transporter
VTPLILFGAGNFIYIAASDLIPEIKSHASPGRAALHFACFVGGAGGLLALACTLAR